MIDIGSVHFIRDFRLTVRNYFDVISFGKEHKIWNGMMAYKWLGKLLLIAAIILSLQLFSSCLNWWEKTTSADAMSLVAIGGLMGNIFKEGYDLFVIGGLKYVVLILAEVVIFHFARRTFEIVTGDSVDSSFRAFVKAQKRMIGVAIYSFVMESILSILAGIGIGILGFSIMKPFIIFLIQCFFLGFAIVDNYNEIFDMTIKQSFRYTRRYAGVALAIGLPVYIVMLMPLLGTIAGPVLVHRALIK